MSLVDILFGIWEVCGVVIVLFGVVAFLNGVRVAWLERKSK